MISQSRVLCSSVIALSMIHGLGSAAADDFPQPRNTEKSVGWPLPAREAAAGFRVPAGFHVSVFAAEPDVQNPIAMAWDSRGRLWIAENYTYAERTQRFDLRQRDRVLIFEDSNGNGKFDANGLYRSSPDAQQHRARPGRRVATLPATIAVSARPQRR